MDFNRLFDDKQFIEIRDLLEFDTNDETLLFLAVFGIAAFQSQKRHFKRNGTIKSLIQKIKDN